MCARTQMERADNVGNSLSEDLLAKVRQGYQGFLGKIKDVPCQDNGTITWEDLASSEALRCLGLSDAQYAHLISYIDSPYGEGVAAKHLFHRLGPLMNPELHATPSVHAADSTNMRGNEVAGIRISWTTFDSSDTYVAAGNSEGSIVVFQLDYGKEVCRFDEMMPPRNGYDAPEDVSSPVTVS